MDKFDNVANHSGAPVDNVPRIDEALRDYFAAAALPGILANPNERGTLQACVEGAYQYADAMLRERKK